ISCYAMSKAVAAQAQQQEGSSVFGDWRTDRPGLRHRLMLSDLPPPYQTPSAGNPPNWVSRPSLLKPKAPAGFTVHLFADRLSAPRTLRVAPNGDVFVAETAEGRVRVIRPSEDGKTASQNSVFASGLSEPFGIAFYPLGPEPKWVYVAEVNRVIRFPYTPGDL